MMWTDIASIVFVSVTANHLGLIGEIEHIYGHRLKVVNCPKCLAFWLTAIYGLWGIHSSYWEFARLFAISFLASYAAIWLELLEGFIDTLYTKVYETIYSDTTNDTDTADGDICDTASTVSDMRKDLEITN